MSYRRAEIQFFPPLTRMVKLILIVTGAIFLLTYLPERFLGFYAPYALFGLTPYAVTHDLALWQPVTYLFLHAGWLHIIFNLFAVWMFGPDLELKWGGRKFLIYFFLTGIGAGLFGVLLQPSSPVMTIGNSGAVYGLLLAYGVLFPDRPVFLWFLIPIKAKWFVAIFGAIEFWLSLTQPGSGVSHVAHLGGMLVGFLYLRAQGYGFSLDVRGRYGDWRRARLRRKFEVYMRKREGKDDQGRWIN